MRGHASLLGTYVEGTSMLHCAPLWSKGLALLLLSSAVLLVNSPAITAVALGLVAIAYLLGARLRLIHLWRPLAPVWPMLVILGGYQLIVNGLAAALLLVANIATCVLAARLLTLTTPGQRLLDGLVALAVPFRRLGADPERFGLTLALMTRSLPYLVGSVADVRDAAKARGLERNPRALVTPVVIGAVAYAHQTGEALAARGLGESSPEDVPGSSRIG